MRLRAIFTNSSGILFSRITGLFRDVFMASALGASVWSDMFFVAFKLPNLFRRIFAEGAFTQAFMPAFIASRHKGVFATTVLLRFLLFLVALSLLVTFFPEPVTKLTAWGWDETRITQTAPLTAVNFWYLDLIFLVTFAATLLQYKEHFATTAFGTALLNIAMIGTLWLFMRHDPATVALALSFGVLLGGVLQVALHLYMLHRFKLDRLLRLGWKYRKKKKIDDETKRFYRLFFPGIVGNAAPQLSSFIDTLLATFLTAGSVSYLFYANRIFQLPLALIAVATSVALFPSIAKALKAGRENEAYDALKRAFWLLMFLLGLATLGGIIFAEPIIWLLFERGNFTHAQTLQTASVLQMYMIGLIPYGLAKLFSLFLYAAHRHTDAAKVSVVSLVVTVTLSLFLMKSMQAAGLALAGSFGGWALFLYTVYHVGFDKLLSILKHRYTLLFFIVMPLAALLFAYINTFLLAFIR